MPTPSYFTQDANQKANGIQEREIMCSKPDQNKRTGRNVMMEMMTRHPDGLTANKIINLVNEKTGLCKDGLMVMLHNLKRHGTIKKCGSSPCECCGAKLAKYRIKT